MYILVKKEFVPDNGRFHETMPDGRLILDISEFKMLGSVPEMQTVATKKELDAIIAGMAETGNEAENAGDNNELEKEE